MKRIAAAVQGYEHGNRKQSAVHFRTATGDDGGGGEFVRLGRISSEWAHGDAAQVDRLDENGSPLDPSETFEAWNFFSTVHVPVDGTANVSCGLVGDTWVLIGSGRGCETATLSKNLDADVDEQAPLTMLDPGDGPQALLSDQGCARWFPLKRLTVVTGVAIEDNALVFTTECLWAFADNECGGPQFISIDGTDCGGAGSGS
jgi:hypothetical protein